ncbi:MAG: hypothetical protein E6J91_09875 [Deltaproteobacteria bacterium]|nr:MAG: hypothetical protein E6J91_09875 [Deltaproteobacteria bacterium]
MDAAIVDHGAARHAAIAGVERVGAVAVRAHPRDPAVDIGDAARGIAGAALEHRRDRRSGAGHRGEVVGGRAVVVALPREQRRQLSARVIDDHQAHEVGIRQLARPEDRIAIEVLGDRGEPARERRARAGRDLGEDGQRLGRVAHHVRYRARPPTRPSGVIGMAGAGSSEWPERGIIGMAGAGSSDWPERDHRIG